ncbi:hypothetical protein HMPREF2863_00990 [Micrococcus sp. HMSC067E09]|uniref:hypothetical protein n=1 Tax=Micrococcus sp. HMSC067E09 TaxID=1739367 RepID=UPI0008A318E1|nr:hypothetical protein [Micrococcus sp. HMSC067E09]OFR88183.1 hypothetical protein HMPREF2863_00990 [Micrococcus sp. HMSC067E09]
MRIHHVQISMPAGQEDEARRFYADALGLTEVQKPPSLAGRGGCWFRGFEPSWTERDTFEGMVRFRCRDGFGNRIEVMTPAVA